MSEDKFDKTKAAQQFDQSSAMVADMFPPMWRRMFLNLQTEGFDQIQSMTLLKVYIAASVCGNVKPE